MRTILRNVHRTSALSSYPLIFLLLYGFVYMNQAVIGVYLPVYLEGIGYSRSAIGTLLALAPFIALGAQPFWGTVGDRAPSKNRILKLLLAGSALSILFFRLSTEFYCMLFIMSLFSFFQTSINPVSDTITLEYLQDKPWSFSPIRMSGTIGYALMAVAAGALFDLDIGAIFVLYFTIALLTLGTAFRLPVIPGHQSEENRVPFWRLLRERELVILLVFITVIHVSLSYYHSFFSIYFLEIGGTGTLLGWSMFLAAGSEVPFLAFADRILHRLGTRLTLLAAGFLGGIRWLIVYSAASPGAVLATQVLHGFHFIVLYIAIVTYINDNVVPELKASGQGFYALMHAGVSRIIGSILGGVLSDLFGIRNLFLYNGLISLLAVALFAVFLAVNRASPGGEIG